MRIYPAVFLWQNLRFFLREGLLFFFYAVALRSIFVKRPSDLQENTFKSLIRKFSLALRRELDIKLPLRIRRPDVKLKKDLQFLYERKISTYFIRGMPHFIHFSGLQVLKATTPRFWVWDLQAFYKNNPKSTIRWLDKMSYKSPIKESHPGLQWKVFQVFNDKTRGGNSALS